MTGPLPAHAPKNPKGKALATLTIGALGVVYGDIGTSPLYALKESFHPSHGLALTPENVLGILSLVFWSLTLVISLKYLVYILRADNRGEGGIMALLGLVIPILRKDGESGRALPVIFLGLFGAALLYGDGVITPAISVLSAVEGLQVATPAFQPYVVPVTVAILVALFLTQRGGTATLGAIFGRTMLVWFLTLIATGLPWIIREPAVLRAIDPMYALQFFAANGWHSYFVLGAVVLCITGGEALYADMGHFGKRPIRLGWFVLAFPALLINYFGQGALVLVKGDAVIDHTFYGLVDGWLIYPLVAIATAATIIASQALISGAFSLTQQAVQLGYLPRMRILHTSRETEGQIYVPRINTLLMAACVALVLVYQESSRLAAMYGIAVTATMSITSILFFVVARENWKWPMWQAGSMVFAFLLVDLAFFGANIVKLHDGGWVPIALAGGIFTVMTTWKRGRQALSEVLMAGSMPLEEFIEERVAKQGIHRVPGTAVFMTLSRDIAPSTLIHHLHHNKVLHEQVVLLSIATRHDPEVPATQRVRVTTLSHGFSKVVAAYGYIESPDIAEILECCLSSGLNIGFEQVSFYMGRETILPDGKTGMARWRKRLFIFFSRNARPATEYFRIPPDRVIEVGAQIQL
jgi:KUP system potassium uptake protein